MGVGAVGEHVDRGPGHRYTPRGGEAPQVGLAVDVAMDGGGVGGDGEVGAEQEEHARRVFGSFSSHGDGQAAVVIHLWFGIVDLQHQEILWLEGEANIFWQLCGLGVLRPGEHDLALVVAHGVVLAVPRLPEVDLLWFPALAEDHVMGPDARPVLAEGAEGDRVHPLDSALPSPSQVTLSGETSLMLRPVHM